MTGLVLNEDQSYGGLRDDLGLFALSVSLILAGLVLSEDQSYGGLRDDLGLFALSVSLILADTTRRSDFTP